MKSKFLKSKSAQRSTQVEQARQEGLIFKSVGLPCVEVAWNGLQIGNRFNVANRYTALFSGGFGTRKLINRQNII